MATSLHTQAPHVRNPAELCQLATHWTGSLPSSGVMAEQKIDGWRALWLRDHAGAPGIFTRNGVPIGGTAHIAYMLEQMERAAGEPMFFDGEFQVGGSLAATKAWCERGWKAGGEAGQLYLFDCMPASEWRAGGTQRPLYARKAMLRDLAQAAQGDGWEWRPGSHGRDDDCPPVTVLEDGWAFDAHDVEREAHAVWARGGEGLMLKDAEAGYERCRNGRWLKVKSASQLRAAA